MSSCIAQLINEGSQKLKTIPTATLDAELLLAFVLQKNRSFLHAWPDVIVSGPEQDLFYHYVSGRRAGKPLAYILGEKEFWSLRLEVTPDVLIPRPETELLVDLALHYSHPHALLADLGTGSGAIALALASERNTSLVYASDICHKALQVAERNAKQLSLQNIIFRQGNWCEALPQIKFDVIVCNPPYISASEWRSVADNLCYEPQLALYDEDGLGCYRHILKDIKSYLKQDGYVLFEHGAYQALALKGLLEDSGMTLVRVVKDLANHDRATVAAMPGL